MGKHMKVRMAVLEHVQRANASTMEITLKETGCCRSHFHRIVISVVDRRERAAGAR